MTTKEFIEKAIEGGWKHKLGGELEPRISVYAMRLPILHYYGVGEIGEVEVLTRGIPAEEILLDPLAWQAVGRVEEWHGIGISECEDCNVRDTIGWRRNMHGLIDALAEGKTFEQFLKTL